MRNFYDTFDGMYIGYERPTVNVIAFAFSKEAKEIVEANIAEDIDFEPPCYDYTAPYTGKSIEKEYALAEAIALLDEIAEGFKHSKLDIAAVFKDAEPYIVTKKGEVISRASIQVSQN